MTDFSANVTKPGLPGSAPVYNTCTTTDKFAASATGRYHLHYKNGATPTGILKVVDQTSASQAPPAAQLSAGWADAQMNAALGASSEWDVWIENPLRFRDASGFINLSHTTPTTLTVAIEGPF